MEDTVEIKLPVSGKVAVIRNYTTRADDEKADQVLYAGVNMKQDIGSDKPALDFPVANVMASKDVYINRLVKTIDDKAASPSLLSELASKDYQSISVEVDKIVEENSPKVKEA